MYTEIDISGHPSILITDDDFSTEEDKFTLEALQKLKYLSAVLDEGFRLYPPVPSPLWRVTPKGGTTVWGGYVPAGTRVAVTAYAASRSPVNFKDPEAFVPERWLAGEEEEDEAKRYKGDRREAMQGFSVGGRNCLGRR